MDTNGRPFGSKSIRKMVKTIRFVFDLIRFRKKNCVRNLTMKPARLNGPFGSGGNWTGSAAKGNMTRGRGTVIRIRGESKRGEIKGIWQEGPSKRLFEYAERGGRTGEGRRERGVQQINQTERGRRGDKPNDDDSVDTDTNIYCGTYMIHYKI